MPFADLRAFLRHLENSRQLARIPVEVDPDQEIAAIHHRIIAANGPALLFEKVKGSPYRVVTNLFGTRERVEMVFGGPPGRLGEEMAGLAQALTPPTIGRLWNCRRTVGRMVNARLRTVATGPVMETAAQPADLNRLPVLTCWPEDGGPFFTLALVQTTDPVSGKTNLGLYRLQRFDAGSTGMHWQIEKGGGFHLAAAQALGRTLPVSAFLGGPPALTLAAVAPLPEGLDERLLAACLMKRPLDVIQRPQGHRIPAAAEFVLEGSVTPGDVKMEGPFGDHLGHYSQDSPFPVYRVTRMLARRDAIYPATVVGKPVQEDYHIGAALQEMGAPLLRLLRPAVRAIWAYPETGFHPLAVMAVDERYPREALKHVLGMLGEGQVALTKVMVCVAGGVDVKNFQAVSLALWRYLDTADGLWLLAPTAQDTLDFTGPALNSGSRLILMALPRSGAPLRAGLPPPLTETHRLSAAIGSLATLGPAFLLVRVTDPAADIASLGRQLRDHPLTGQYIFHVLLSGDVPLDDPLLVLWGWFTRFDPLADLHPAQRRIDGNRLVLQPPIVIDARWKPGYPKPVAIDPDVAKTVDRRWKSYGLR
jgi:UbiD family decarboxylase